MPSYKVVLLGDGGVGKTTLALRLLNQPFTRKYIATIGVDVHSITHNGLSITIWDTAGQEKFCGLRDAYYVDADLAIIMCDTTNKVTHINAGKWAADFRRVCPRSPTIYLANKINLQPPSNHMLHYGAIGIDCKNDNVAQVVLDLITSHL